MQKSQKCFARELCLCLQLYHHRHAGDGRKEVFGAVSENFLCTKKPIYKLRVLKFYVYLPLHLILRYFGYSVWCSERVLSYLADTKQTQRPLIFGNCCQPAIPPSFSTCPVQVHGGSGAHPNYIQSISIHLFFLQNIMTLLSRIKLYGYSKVRNNE